MNYRLLLAATLSHLVIDIHQGALPVLLPILREQYALSYALVTSLVLVLQIASSLLQPSVGLLSDRSSFRWLVPISCLLAGTGYLFLLGGSYAMAALGIFLSGVGVAAFHPEGSKLAHFASGHRKAWSLSIFSLGGTVGTAIGPLYMGVLVGAYGLNGVVGLLAVALPAAAVIAWFVPKLYADVPDLRHTRPESKRPAGTSRAAAYAPLVLLLLVVVMRSWAHISATTFIPLYFVSHLGHSTQFGSALLTTYLTAGAIASIAMGWAADRWGSRATVIVTLVLATGFLYWFPHATGIWSFVSVALAGSVVVSTFGVTTALGQQMMPHNVGLASGLVMGATVGTGAFGTVLLGYIADNWGIESAMAGIPLFAFVAALLAIALVLVDPAAGWRQRRDPGEPAPTVS